MPEQKIDRAALFADSAGMTRAAQRAVRKALASNKPAPRSRKAKPAKPTVKKRSR